MEDSNESVGDSIRPEPSIDDEEEACILEELAQDIRRLLQDSKLGAVQESAVEVVPPRQQNLHSNSSCDTSGNQPNQEGEKASSTIYKGDISGSIQAHRKNQKSCRVPVQASTHSSSKPAVGQQRFTMAEKEKWVAKPPSPPPPRAPWKATSKVQSTSALQAHQDACKQAGEPSWRMQSAELSGESRGNWKEVKGPYWWRREQQASRPLSEEKQRTAPIRGIERFK